MKYTYIPKGTCSRKIEFELDGNIVHDISFTGGCHGNLQGLARLAQGMTIDEITEKLEGIKCGHKPTSCPDQLAQALKKAKNEIAP